MPLLHVGMSVVLSLGFAATASAAEDMAVPVLWESPGCDHAKLGTINVEVGERVSEITQDPNVPTVDYARALARLADAAEAKGANAVVLRWHQGVYFTRTGKRSRRPVYVKLRGAAIRLPEGAGQCQLTLAYASELEQRAQTGKPVNVSSHEAFGDD